jgi:hypothetical protein
MGHPAEIEGVGSFFDFVQQKIAKEAKKPVGPHCP